MNKQTTHVKVETQIDKIVEQREDTSNTIVRQASTVPVTTELPPLQPFRQIIGTLEVMEEGSIYSLGVPMLRRRRTSDGTPSCEDEFEEISIPPNTEPLQHTKPAIEKAEDETKQQEGVTPTPSASPSSYSNAIFSPASVTFSSSPPMVALDVLLAAAPPMVVGIPNHRLTTGVDRLTHHIITSISPTSLTNTSNSPSPAALKSPSDAATVPGRSVPSVPPKLPPRPLWLQQKIALLPPISTRLIPNASGAAVELLQPSNEEYFHSTIKAIAVEPTPVPIASPTNSDYDHMSSPLDGMSSPSFSTVTSGRSRAYSATSSSVVSQSAFSSTVMSSFTDQPYSPFSTSSATSSTSTSLSNSLTGFTLNERLLEDQREHGGGVPRKISFAASTRVTGEYVNDHTEKRLYDPEATTNDVIPTGQPTAEEEFELV